MSTIESYPHLAPTDDGELRIGGTRYKVRHLAAEHFHYGWSAEELMRQHPDLRPEEIYSALTYIYDHYAELVEQLTASPNREQSPPLQPSRAELRSRLQARQ